MHNSIPRWIFLAVMSIVVGVGMLLIVNSCKPNPSYPAADETIGEVSICFQK